VKLGLSACTGPFGMASTHDYSLVDDKRLNDAAAVSLASGMASLTPEK